VIWWGGGWRGHGLKWKAQKRWSDIIRYNVRGYYNSIQLQLKLQWFLRYFRFNFEFCRFFDWPSVCRVLANIWVLLIWICGLFADFLLFLNNEQRPYIIPCPVCLRSSIYFKNVPPCILYEHWIWFQIECCPRCSSLVSKLFLWFYYLSAFPIPVLTSSHCDTLWP